MKAQLLQETTAPAWLTLPAGERYSGLSARLLQNAIARGLVRSSIVRMPGARRGRRLIDRRSLDRWIEAGVGKSADLPHLAANCEAQRAKASRNRKA